MVRGPDNPILHPEQAFHAAVDSLKRGAESYRVPSYIENSGVYWTTRINPKTGLEEPYFDPDAYDPRKPELPRGNVYILESNPTWLLEDPFDLENLRIMEKEKVRGLLSRLEELTNDPKEKNKLITCVIGTGGTIAMHRNEKGEDEPGLNIADLLAETAQGIPQRFAVVSEDFPTLIDSSQMEIDYNAELIIAMSWIWKNASAVLKKRFAGFLVAHGTDTMAGSSAYAAMMLGPNCPFSVGFFGAQKKTSDRRTDAYANTKLAFENLEDLYLTGVKEKFVAMGGTSGGAYPAVGVDKVSDRLVTAFAPLGYPAMIEASDFGEGGITATFFHDYIKKTEYQRLPRLGEKSAARPNERFNLDFWPIILRGYSHVLALEPREGHDPRIYENAIRNNPDARFILLTTFGAFTASNKIRKAIMEAVRAAHKGVFAANPFPEGKLTHLYVPAAELRRSGVNATAILPIALEAKILLAQRLFGENTRRVTDFVTKRNYVGEQPPVYWESYVTGEQERKDLDVGIGLLRKDFRILHQGKIS